MKWYFGNHGGMPLRASSKGCREECSEPQPPAATPWGSAPVFMLSPHVTVLDMKRVLEQGHSCLTQNPSNRHLLLGGTL